MSLKVESLFDNRLISGKGAHWDVSSQSLYLVDCLNKSILRYVPETGELFEAILDGKVSIIIPVEGSKDKFLITVDKKICIVTWDGKSPKVSNIEILLEAETDKKRNRFNEGTADSSGRLWIGSMGPWGSHKRGCLYSLISKNTLKQHVDKITATNGLTFDDKLKKLYFMDALTNRVDSFDFDLSKGTLDNRQTVFKFEDNDIPGRPGGMTIDTEGKLWVACANGGRIIRIDPLTSKLLKTVKVPAMLVTSPTFGGPDLDTLYATTCSFKFSEDAEVGPSAGSILKITGLGVKGFPGRNVKL